jgi:hypothetical protein
MPDAHRVTPGLRARRAGPCLAGACLVSAGLVVLLAPGEATAHFPASVEMSVQVEAESVRLRLFLAQDIFETWFGFEPQGLEASAGAPWDRARRTTEERIGDWARVRIDGVVVEPTLEDLERSVWDAHGIPHAQVEVTLAYARRSSASRAEEPPRQVAVAWTHYDAGSGATFDRLETEIGGFGETSYHVLRASEPEAVWHRPRTPVVQDAPPPPPEPRRVTVPLAGAAAGLLLAVLAILSLRFRGLRRPWWGCALAATAVALTVGNVGAAAVSLPWATVERPGAEEAGRLFESLLRNVYRAFEADREQAIYDTLAGSVAGPLLDGVYQEVYASLVMTEQGGAVSKVEQVDVLARDVSFPADPDDPTFRVHARWRVLGKVGHWGHTHRRVIEHEADYTVAPHGGTWKIVGVQVLAQRRVEPGAEANR